MVQTTLRLRTLLFYRLTDYLGAVLLSMIFSLSCLRACNLFFFGILVFFKFLFAFTLHFVIFLGDYV